MKRRHKFSSIKPEKSQLEVAIAAWGATSLPTAVALDGGYFAKHGLAVNISVVAASTSVQALISGKVDIYQGGATAIAGNLGGADIIYVGASVDKSSLMLLGQKGITRLNNSVVRRSRQRRRARSGKLSCA